MTSLTLKTDPPGSLSLPGLEAILAATPDVVTVVDREARILYVNRPREVIGQSALDFMPRDQHARWLASLRQAFQSGEHQTVEVDAYVGDVLTRFETRMGPVIEDGEVRAVALVSRDIGSWRSARERRSEATLHAVVSAIPDQLLRIRGDGLIMEHIESGPFDDSLPPAMFVGHRVEDFTDLVGEAGISAFQTSVASALETGEMRTVELTVDRDDCAIHYEIRIVPVAVDEVLTFSHDVTEARARELALAESERRLKETVAGLGQANAELEAFAQTVSHDLRAPLRAMHGLAELVLADHGDALDREAQDYLERIVRAAARMDTLIRDLLTYSRMGRTEIPRSQVDLTSLVGEVVAETTALGGPPIQVRGPMPRVVGHPLVLQQVLGNLLSNARKFQRAGVEPEIVVSARAAGGRFVEVSVEDNGIGVDPIHHQRIFDLFERLHTGGVDGTGVGLGIVRRGVERLGGRVGVESTLGRGSRFWFTLPAG